MQHRNHQVVTPIHNNMSRKGTLRRAQYNNKVRKISLNENANNLMLDLMNNQFLFQNRNHKQLMYERNSMLSSIRCRNLRKKQMQDKRKDLYTAQGRVEQLRLEPVKQIPNIKAQIEGKNKSLFNISICRRTTPIKLTYSRSKTARENSLITKMQQPISLPGRGLLGYHISSHSPMNKKISWFSN